MRSGPYSHLAFEALFVWTVTCHLIYQKPVSLHQYCTLWTQSGSNYSTNEKVLLGPEVLKKFRPVYNLTYLSKIIEHVVVVWLNQHLTKNGLQEVLQSAYKHNHSTETALLKVQNDLLVAIDTYGRAVLTLLDYLQHLIL